VGEYLQHQFVFHPFSIVAGAISRSSILESTFKLLQIGEDGKLYIFQTESDECDLRCLACGVRKEFMDLLSENTFLWKLKLHGCEEWKWIGRDITWTN